MRPFLVVLALWLTAAALVACGPDKEQALIDDSLQATKALSSTRVRLMAGNLSSGNGQDYNSGHGIRIFQGLKPDIVMIQEFNFGNDSETAIRSFVDQTFGSTFSYVRGAPTQIPNGVISRYPIIASGDWNDTQVDNREFTWARIDVPGPVDLWAISVHLLTTGAGPRQSETANLTRYIQANVPSGDYVVIGGDFNVGSRSETSVKNLSSVVATAGPYPVDSKGNGNTSASRSKPLDWLLVSDGLTALGTPTVVGNNSFPNGFIADTRVYSPVGDLSPALSSDSAAPSMQHMGVVRDFSLPSEASVPFVRAVVPNGGETLAAGATQTIRWSSFGVSLVNVDYSADGLTFGRVASNVAASTGELEWVIPASTTTSARIRVSDAQSMLTDESDAPFTVIDAGPPPSPQVIINEVLANEPGSNSAGEFIELYNAGGTAADLSGWTLSDATVTRHVFPVGVKLEGGATLVVFGKLSAAPPNTASVAEASTGTLGLSNSGDSVKLSDASSTVVDSLAYSSALAAVDGVSMNRSPERTPGATLVLHTALSPRSNSPTRSVNDTP